MSDDPNYTISPLQAEVMLHEHVKQFLEKQVILKTRCQYPLLDQFSSLSLGSDSIRCRFDMIHQKEKFHHALDFRVQKKH